MKKLLFSLATLTLLLSVNSCSDTEQSTTNSIENSANSREETSEESYVTYRDTRYTSIDQNTVSKQVNGNFVNYFTTPDNNIGYTEESVDFSSEFQITNRITDERIRIINIRQESDLYVFDAETSNGDIVRDLAIHLQSESNSTQRLNPRVILIIVSAILDSLQPSPLEQCTSAMNALNCRGNTNPYMNFQDGWFSTSCSVGCR